MKWFCFGAFLSCPFSHVQSSCGQVVGSEEDSIHLNVRKYFILVTLAVQLMSACSPLLLTSEEPGIGSPDNLVLRHFGAD